MIIAKKKKKKTECQQYSNTDNSYTILNNTARTIYAVVSDKSTNIGIQKELSS